MGMKILHVDVNNAFLSWTAVDMLEKGSKIDIRNIPAIIGGDEASRRGIVLAKSNIAKKFGIVTGETIYSARKKCPNVKVFLGSYERYHEYSDKLYNLLLEYTDKVERFSVDECFLDMTEYLMGKDILAVAKEIKDRVEKELKFTVNIGISENKVLAKMASDFEKPNKIHTLYKYEIKDKMWKLDVEELFMLGKKTVPKLNKLGIYKIGDIAKKSKEYMINKFGVHGKTMWEYANGIDNSKVQYIIELPKSISHSTTFVEDTADFEKLCKVLIDLTDKVTYRLRKHQLCASVVTVQIRTKNFENYTKQKKLSVPTSVTREIYEEAKKLLKEVYKERELRLIGVGVSDLIGINENYQTSIFDIGKENKEHKKYEKVDKIVDEIKNKYGMGSITIASKLNVTKLLQQDNK